MNIQYWGTRGSIATIGIETQRYGGNTPCVSVTHGDHLLILDAGTGIHRLSKSDFHTRFKHIHILLSHLHMDHIQGLGFFDPFFNAESTVHIWGPPSSRHSLLNRLTRYLSPPLFPFTISEFQCDLHVHELFQGVVKIGPYSILTRYVCHPGPTLGIRISTNEFSCTYIPDHEVKLGSINFPNDPLWTSGFDLAKETDLLIHDAQYSEEEYTQRKGWGHSTVSQAIDFAQLAQAKRLHIFHHSPNHSDDEIDQLLADLDIGHFNFEIEIAREGAQVNLAD